MDIKHQGQKIQCLSQKHSVQINGMITLVKHMGLAEACWIALEDCCVSHSPCITVGWQLSMRTVYSFISKVLYSFRFF